MSQKIQSTAILGIETSCDETAVSIVRYEEGSIYVLGNIVSSQIKLHAKYGGVVPNLAAREHAKNIFPVLRSALIEAHLSPKDIDAIAVTCAPGLIPALLVGTTTARTLSWLWEKPLLGIHHIEGHIYANFISESKDQKIKNKGDLNSPTSNFQPSTSSSTFPLLALVVSGGHTQLILMSKHFDYTIVGETQDDAAGEAFDKVARILGLGYPGGPAVSRRALQAQETTNLQPITHNLQPLPRPMLHSPDFNFSFSGLKTAVLYVVQKFRKENTLSDDAPLPETFVNALCAEFQQSAIDVLVHKTIKAAKRFEAKTIILAGGVSANTELRKQLGESITSSLPHVQYKVPEMKYSVDNAAMIATAAAMRWSRMSEVERKNTKENWKTLQTFAHLPLGTH